MTLTELSNAMGYKSITAKLSRTVKEMYKLEIIDNKVEDNQIKYTKDK